MRFVYAFLALICAWMICYVIFPTASLEYHLLATSIVFAGALAGGD